MKVFKEKFLEWLESEIKREHELSAPSDVITYRAIILKEVRDNLLRIIEDEYAKIIEAKK